MRPRRRAGGSIASTFLAVNSLLVFLPVASFLSFGSYEKSLLESQEQSMAQEGRVLAAWLGESGLDAARARAAIAALAGESNARLRVVDSAGTLLADSATLAPAPERAAGEAYRAGPGNEDEGRESPLYRLYSLPVRLVRDYLLPPQPALESADFYGSSPSLLRGREVKAALAGSYGAATRISSGGQVSVTLYSAIPVRAPGRERTVEGAVLVSQSTWRILSAIYRFRLDAGKIFLWSILASTALSIALALSIARPLRRLAARAAGALTPLGLEAEAFPPSRRRDEIGELEDALSAFAARLKDRLRWAEGFASDAAHELKNPLAALRAAAELELGSGSGASSLARIVLEETDRMRRSLDGLRSLSAIDAGAGDPEALEPALLVSGLAEGLRSRGRGVDLALGEGAAEAKVRVDPARLEVALRAILENADSFAPEGSAIEIGLHVLKAEGGGSLSIAVRDRGPGIPEEHLEKVFDRFFTWRPEGGEGHAGLGLSLAKAIAEKSGGSLVAANAEGGGALFALSLPLDPGTS